MEATLNLTAQRVIRLLDEPVILPDTLTVRISSGYYHIDALIISVKNGEKTGKFKVHKDDKLIDLKEFLFAGKIEMMVAMLVSGEPVKKWSVEPIIIKDAGIEAEAVPEIEEVKAELARTKKALAELTASVQNDTL